METPGQLVRRDGVVRDTRNTTITVGTRHDEIGRPDCRVLVCDTNIIDRHGTTLDNNAFRKAT